MQEFGKQGYIPCPKFRNCRFYFTNDTRLFFFINSSNEFFSQIVHLDDSAGKIVECAAYDTVCSCHCVEVSYEIGFCSAAFVVYGLFCGSFGEDWISVCRFICEEVAEKRGG